MDLVPHYVDHEQAVGCVGPVVIRVIDSADTEPADIDRLARLIDDVLARAPIAGIWVVIHHDTPIPDGAARRYMGRVMKPYNERLCTVYTMLGLGFWASTASAATVTIGKFIGVHTPVTSSIEAGAQSLCMELIGLNPARLVAAHEALMARMTAHAKVP